MPKHNLDQLNIKLDEMMEVISSCHSVARSLFEEEYGFWFGVEPQSESPLDKLREITLAMVSLERDRRNKVMSKLLIGTE